MLLILKKLFLTSLLPDIFRYDSLKKCPTILYAVNLWLKPVSANGASLCHVLKNYNWSNLQVTNFNLYRVRVDNVNATFPDTLNTLNMIKKNRH